VVKAELLKGVVNEEIDKAVLQTPLGMGILFGVT